MAGEAVVGEAVRPARLALPMAAVVRTVGAIAGPCAFFVLIGLFGQFARRWLVVGLVDIGHALFAAAALGGGFALARRHRTGAMAAGVAAVLAGAVAGAALMLLTLAAAAVNLRWMFVSLTPPTLKAVGFGLEGGAAGAMLAAGGAGFALLGALGVLLPVTARRILLGALGGVAAAGLLRELLRSLFAGVGGLEGWAVNYDGLLPGGALAASVVGAVAALRPGRAAARALSPRARVAAGVALVLLALAVPAVTNDFVAQVAMLVCLYTLMGFGLNVELGLAGLVDLGFVAFFAVGAYTVALLTAGTAGAPPSLGFFQALPLAVILAAVAGFLFGLPVLKVRGDYLAIATLGLGEIIRVLVLSDMLKPLLGGAQGIVNIPKPALFGLVLGSPTRLFYLTVCVTALAGWCAWRLQHSGLGRRWLAVREDEDVAQALGINLVGVKLSAYTIGASFAGLAGGVFAAMVGSVFPQSFQLLVSVNVLAILVVGGIGSLPGVIVGAALLIGAPEVLRDLGEYRYLIYGLVIIAVVRLKPDGLSPKSIRHREAL